ncbi:MAG: hypothetical protein H0U57_10400 [Tatlockia sp.]|nr:hypothetical protein [Tatlockia sp.]
MIYRLDNLCAKSVEEIRKLIATIPPTATTLDLSANKLDYKTGAELALIFAAIPPWITTLNLRQNRLGYKSVEELATAFSAISVPNVDLWGNILDFKEDDALVKIFSAFHYPVSSLNLGRNHFTGDQLALFMTVLSSSIEHLKGDDVSFNTNEFWVNELLYIVILNGSNRMLANLPKLEFAVKIDNKRLVAFVKRLEEIGSPCALLTAGLLLHGIIKTTDQVIEGGDDTAYFEKKLHDAISFYLKAANDSSMKPISEFYLENIKMTSQIPSVLKRLAEYDLGSNRSSQLSQLKKESVITPLLKDIGLFNKLRQAKPAPEAPQLLPLEPYNFESADHSSQKLNI